METARAVSQPTATSGKGYLLVRSGGALWGVDNAAVESLKRGESGFRLGVVAGELRIDEIVGVVTELAVRPVTAALTRFWPETASGLAVHAAEPLVVVDPRRPPRALCGPQSGGGGKRRRRSRTG